MNTFTIDYADGSRVSIRPSTVAGRWSISTLNDRGETTAVTKPPHAVLAFVPYDMVDAFSGYLHQLVNASGASLLADAICYLARLEHDEVKRMVKEVDELCSAAMVAMSTQLYLPELSDELHGPQVSA